MVLEGDVTLREGGKYTLEQIAELEQSKKIYRLAESTPGVIDCMQGNYIYSLKFNGNGTLEVVDCLKLNGK